MVLVFVQFVHRGGGAIRNVTKQEKEREREAARAEGRDGVGSSRPVALCSAGAVGGRRLPSTDAHDQFLCKRRRRTGEREQPQRSREEDAHIPKCTG